MICYVSKNIPWVPCHFAVSFIFQMAEYNFEIDEIFQIFGFFEIKLAIFGQRNKIKQFLEVLLTATPFYDKVDVLFYEFL